MDPAVLAHLDQIHAQSRTELREAVAWLRNALDKVDGDRNVAAAAYVVMVLNHREVPWPQVAGLCALALAELAANGVTP